MSSVVSHAPASRGRRSVVARRISDFVASPLVGIDWSISYIALLAYVFATISFRVPIGTVAMSIALGALLFESKPLRFPPLVGWASVFVLWALIGSAASDYPQIVLDRSMELAKICGIMLVMVNVLTSRARIRFFLLFMVVVFAAYPLRGTLFSYLGGNNLHGRATWNYIYSNPNDLASLCLLQLAIALGLLRVETKAWVVWGTRLSVTLLCLSIILTQSRGAMIGLAFFSVNTLRTHWRDLKKLLGVAAVAMLVVMFAPDSVWKRFSTVFKGTDTASFSKEQAALDENSAGQRLEIWKVARSIIVDHPLTGVGLGAYKQVHFIYAQRQEFDPTARGERDTHSTYLNILAETGIIGLACFAALMVGVIRRSRRARRRAKSTAPELAAQLFYLEVGLYGFLVAGVWGTYSAIAPTYIYLALISATTSMLEERLGAAVAAPSRMLQSVRRGRARLPASPSLRNASGSVS